MSLGLQFSGDFGIEHDEAFFLCFYAGEPVMRQDLAVLERRTETFRESPPKCQVVLQQANVLAGVELVSEEQPNLTENHDAGLLESLPLCGLLRRLLFSRLDVAGWADHPTTSVDRVSHTLPQCEDALRRDLATDFCRLGPCPAYEILGQNDCPGNLFLFQENTLLPAKAGK